jgi:hypothetical protein
LQQLWYDVNDSRKPLAILLLKKSRGITMDIKHLPVSGRLPVIAIAIMACLFTASVHAADEAVADTGSNKVHPVAEVKKVGKAVGHGVKDSTKAVGHGVRDGTRAVGHEARKVTKEVGHAFRDGPRKVEGKTE